MEITGYDYIFSDSSRTLKGEVKVDFDNDDQEEVLRVYKESDSGERSEPIIVKIFENHERCPREVFGYQVLDIEVPEGAIYTANEFLENPQVFENFWGDGVNAVSLEAIGTAYGSGSTAQLLIFTYRNGEYSVIMGPQVAGHNWQCCKFDGDNGVGQKIIAAESRWAEDPSDYCAGCDSRFQFFIYNWNGEKYIKTEGGITENKYSGDIEKIIKKEPFVVSFILLKEGIWAIPQVGDSTRLMIEPFDMSFRIILPPNYPAPEEHGDIFESFLVYEFYDENHLRELNKLPVISSVGLLSEESIQKYTNKSDSILLNRFREQKYALDNSNDYYNPGYGTLIFKEINNHPYLVSPQECRGDIYGCALVKYITFIDDIEIDINVGFDNETTSSEMDYLISQLQLVF